MHLQVSRNWAPQLAGNVYVQYASAASAAAALERLPEEVIPMAGQRATCHLCLITDWRQTLCGRFERGHCDQGKRCPFVHAFRNPKRRFERLTPDGQAAS